MSQSRYVPSRKRSKWYEIAHEKFYRIPDAGRKELDFESIPALFCAWFNDYGKNKFARLRNLEDPDRYLFVRMYCRFMKEYKEMLRAKFGWLHFVKFTKFLSFTVDPNRFFHLHDEFEAANKGWHKMASWLRKSYGKFFYVRVLELQKSGRPHLHILAVLPEWVDYDKMRKLWDKKYGIGVQCRFKSVDQRKGVDGLNYVLKYVTKTITNLEESEDNLYSALLFASNRRLFSIADVRTGPNSNPLLETHKRATATWEFQGSVYASLLKSFCEEYDVTLGDFVQISLFEISDLRLYEDLFGEYND